MSSTVACPVPEEPLDYPIHLGGADSAADASDALDVTLFNALQWLRPLYELAGWLPKVPHQPKKKAGEEKDEEEAKRNDTAKGTAARTDKDVATTLTLLPDFEKFFTEQNRIIPQHTDLYYYIESFTFPTPKGPRTITRSKVEGDYRAKHTQPVHGGQAASSATVTNSTAYFSLLPGHNHFLLYYESKEKLAAFNYLQLDQLRFAWVAMKELLEESKVFHLHDGSLTGLAKRDVKNNNANTPYSVDANGDPVVAATASSSEGGSALDKVGAGGGGGGGASAGKTVGKGGGNARLHQGTSGNVITGPSKEVLESKREMQQKRFLRQQLEDECQRRWPYTPTAKSCLVTVEEKVEAELPTDARQQLGLGPSNATNRNGKARRGPKFYLGHVELPLANKKGGSAHFKAPRFWNNRQDAENAAAEVALLALRNMKT